MRAVAFEREHRVDHVLDHARAGDLAVLGDMADQHDAGAGLLRKADERLRGGAHLRDRAGRGFHHVGPHGLDGIDHDQPRRLSARQGREDVLDRGFGGELDLGVRQRQPLGAQPHLRDGFLAGDIDRALADARERGRDLNEQRRLADAGIAADEQHRAAHEPAAGDAVEFGQSGGKARRFMRFARQRFEREGASLARRLAGTARADAAPAFSSASVFHSPQASHLPCQRP